MRVRPLLAVIFLILGACGFHPMYGGSDGRALRQNLDNITVAPIPDRLGQLVRNSLLDQMTGNGGADAQYRLSVFLNLEEEGVGFRQDEAITRTNVMLTADYRVVRLADKQVALAGKARVFGAYDVVESDFSTLVARRDIKRNLAERVATQIHTRLAAHFRPGKGDKADEAQAARN